MNTIRQREWKAHFTLAEAVISGQYDSSKGHVLTLGTPNFVMQALWDTRAQTGLSTAIVVRAEPYYPSDKSCRLTTQWANVSAKASTRAYGRQNTPLNITQYPFFSAAHEAFSKGEHILRDETSLTKYQTTEINPITLSYHDATKLETNSKGIDRKHTHL